MSGNNQGYEKLIAAAAIARMVADNGPTFSAEDAVDVISSIGLTNPFEVDHSIHSSVFHHFPGAAGVALALAPVDHADFKPVPHDQRCIGQYMYTHRPGELVLKHELTDAGYRLEYASTGDTCIPGLLQRLEIVRENPLPASLRQTWIGAMFSVSKQVWVDWKRPDVSVIELRMNGPD